MRNYNREDYVAQQEERKAQLEKKFNDIISSYQTNPALISEFIKFSTRFHNYSFKNQVLIREQNPGALFSGSFNKFKELGYSINKGEHGMKIFVPVISTMYFDENTNLWQQLKNAPKDIKEKVKSGEIKSKQYQRFKLGTVFDISQTNCPAEEYPKLLGFGHNDTEHNKLFKAVINYAYENNITVSFSNLGSAIRGQFRPLESEIVLNDKLQTSMQLSVLTHELAHSIMHRDIEIEPTKPTAQKEIEADCLSLMLREKLGISDIEDTRQQHLTENFKNYLQETETNEELPGIEDVLSGVVNAYDSIYEDFSNSITAYLENQNSLEVGQAINGAEFRYEVITSDLPIELINCHFYNCRFENLTATDLHNSVFTDCNFNNCDLSHANLHESEIYYTQFKNTNLSVANMTATKIKHTSFSKASNLSEVMFNNSLIEDVWIHDIQVDNPPTGLETALVTMGSATPEEEQSYREKIFDKLKYIKNVITEQNRTEINGKQIRFEILPADSVTEYLYNVQVHFKYEFTDDFVYSGIGHFCKNIAEVDKYINRIVTDYSKDGYTFSYEDREELIQRHHLPLVNEHSVLISTEKVNTQSAEFSDKTPAIDNNKLHHEMWQTIHKFEEIYNLPPEQCFVEMNYSLAQWQPKENITSEQIEERYHEAKKYEEYYNNFLEKTSEYINNFSISDISSYKLPYIHFCYSSNIKGFNFDMPIREAEIFTRELDSSLCCKNQISDTKFIIYWQNDNSDTYIGKQTLGNGEGGLIEHIDHYHNKTTNPETAFSKIASQLKDYQMGIVPGKDIDSDIYAIKEHGIADVMDNDLFFVDKINHTVEWAYYNPDSDSSGSIVVNKISFTDIQEAMSAPQQFGFFSSLESMADQTYYDSDTPDFQDLIDRYNNMYPTFVDMSKNTMNSLINSAGISIENALQNQGGFFNELEEELIDETATEL